jgi:hypothetical protein
MITGEIKQKKLWVGAFVCSLFLGLAGPAKAFFLDVGVTAKAGTTGIGGDRTVPIITNCVNIRAGYNWFELRPSLNEGGLKYKGSVELETIPILVDVHPFNGGFRVTGGVFYNNNQVGLSTFASAGTLVGTAPIGTSTTLAANVKWAKEFAPYFGIGYGNAAEDEILGLPIGFSLDVGAFYQGSPTVTLTDSSGLIPASDLLAEQLEIQEDLKDFRFYPVITVGIHINF